MAAKEINGELGTCLKVWSKEVAQISPKLIPLNRALVEACEGGKRIRGTLVKLGFELTGAQYNPEILKPASACEIFHTAILAHDDIIDQSPTRRGKPTLHQALGGNHYGISQTICLGDIGFFLAQKLIAESKFPDKEKNAALISFTNTVLDTGLGEMLDVELPYSKGKKTEKDVEAVFLLKTAHYTIVGPLQLGAILGGGKEKLLQDIERFGESLGIAFQIQDDILGIFGSEEVVGKSVTSDIEEGKVTLLFLYALKHASKEQEKVLNKFYGQGKIGRKEYEQVKQVFSETKALEYCQEKALDLAKEAKKVIKGMEISTEHKQLLAQMADFMVKRDS